MKKTIIAIASVMLFVACGGSNESNEPKPVEATYDSVGVDSSSVLPPLADHTGLDTPKAVITDIQ